MSPLTPSNNIASRPGGSSGEPLVNVRPPRTEVAFRTRRQPGPANLAELVARLGDVPLTRIPLNPPLGRATEEDVINPPDGTGSLYELVDGVLVEKPIGMEESRLATRMGGKLDDFAARHGLGVVSGSDGPFRPRKGLVRMPDVAFFSNDRLEEEIEGEAISSAVPDLGVEVLSKGNTKAEMARKLNEYFAAGVRCVWMLDPKRREVKVYTSPEDHTLLTEDDELDGGDILPGFRYSIRDWLSVLNQGRRARK